MGQQDLTMKRQAKNNTRGYTVHNTNLLLILGLACNQNLNFESHTVCFNQLSTEGVACTGGPPETVNNIRKHACLTRNLLLIAV